MSRNCSRYRGAWLKGHCVRKAHRPHTRRRMMQSTQQTKLAELAALKATICATPTLTPEQLWFYPSAPPVQGFCGTDPLILVGYRPSYNEWTPSDRGRRRLY